MASYVPERDLALQEFGRFLAACYYEPGPEFLEERVFDSIVRAAGILGSEFVAPAGRLGPAFEEAGHERLLVDYARLFLGPLEIRAQPYESHWTITATDSRGFSASIETLYEEGGFEIADDFRELPDHIAAELEFLYLLRCRENHARDERDSAGVAMAARLRRRLLGEHLALWVPQFTAAIIAGAECDYFRELAALTERYVAVELGETGIPHRS